MKRTRARLVRRLVQVLIGAAVAFVVAFATVLAAVPLLSRTAVTHADVIVVLGGDGTRRAAKAAALYKAGAAPRVLVSGDGDCEDVRRLMVEAEVPNQVIEVECASRNTYENALFSAPLLTEMHAQRGILVTSWFHTRRALKCFRMASPRIEWMTAPVERNQSIWDMMTMTDGLQFMKEYVKLGWYVFRCPAGGLL